MLEEDSWFRFTLFYGNPKVNLRMSSWNLLRRLKDGLDGPWLVMGNFNKILEKDEMCEKRDRGSNQMRRFKEALWDFNLSDIKLTNESFTFSNRRRGADETKTRIGRVIANAAWHRLWPRRTLRSCFANSSYHKPIMVNLERPGRRHSTGQTGFRFEPTWLRDETFMESVSKAWTRSREYNATLCDKLDNCGKSLLAWNVSKFGNMHARIKKLKEQLEKLGSVVRTEELINMEAQLSTELDEWLAREELI